MAYSAANVALAARNAAADDVPMILAAHCLRDDTIAVERWNDLGTTGDADETADFAPIHRAYDEFANAGNHTKPSSGKNTWYLVFQFDFAQTFDALVLVGSNLEDATAVTVEIADNSAFSTNLLEISAPSFSAGQMRAVDLELGAAAAAQQYSGVEFLRVKITGSTFTPRIRELWIGQRSQLLYPPTVPYDDTHQRTVIGVSESKSGVITHAAVEASGIVRRPKFNLDTVDASTAQTFWEYCNWGSSPFWWIETPGSSPQAYLMRYDGDPEFAAPIIGNNARQWVLPMREEAPFLAFE